MSSSKIYLSLPSNPNVYLQGDGFSWAQICYHVYAALKNKYNDKVEYLDYFTTGSSYPFKPNDLFITTLSDYKIVDNMLWFPRTILIDNNDMNVSKWKLGKFNKYGYNAQTDCSYKYNKHLTKCLFQFVQTNDVAISKWNCDHIDVLELKNFYIKNDIKVFLLPHSIDKERFARSNVEHKPEKIKMLIYNNGWRKNAVELIKMLRNNGYREGIDFSIMSQIDKKSNSVVNEILNEFSIIAHTSFSEGFPYLVNEFMTQGMLPFCHEEWWDGYDNDQLLWSYDPNLQWRNLRNINFLLNPTNINQVQDLKETIWQTHSNRIDNNWDYFCSHLIEEIGKVI